MRARLGLLSIMGPGLARPVTIDTITCWHCNRVVMMNGPDGRKVHEATAWCLCCNEAICRACGDKPCTPFEKQCEQIERRFHDRRAIESWG